MNIWLLTSEYPPDYGGGIATYCSNTVKMLSARGHHLTVFAAAEHLEGGSRVEESSSNVRVVRFAANQSPQSAVLGEFARWSYDAAIVLSDYCKREGRPDVLEAQEYLGMPYFTLQRSLCLDDALRDLPVLVTAHTPLYLCRAYDLLPTHRFPAYWTGEMERYSMLAANGLVFPSRYLRDEIEKDLPQLQGRSRVIPYPFQYQAESSPVEGNSSRRGFLFIARIERRKGIEPLLATFRQMWNDGLDEPLYLVGDDWYDELRERWMSETIKKRFASYVDAKLLCWEGKQPPQVVQQKLNETRALVLPSLLENYPNAVLEAMSAGCPVIVSQSGGHAEMVENGISGFVFSHLEKHDLQHKLQSVLALSPDEHNRIVNAARQRVKQINDVEVIAPQKEEAYDWVRKQKHPSRIFPFLRHIPRQQPVTDAQAPDVEPGLLSVVIPFYNLGKYLEDALQSFDDLTDVPFEIIVVDDGSNDQASLAKLSELQARYNYRLERTVHQGLPATRNAGAQLARGEYLTFLDVDDCMDPRYYQKAIQILNHYENVSYVGCWAIYFGDVEYFWPTWNPEPPYALVHNPINTSSLVYRRVDFLRHGLNDTSIAFILEDYDSMLSMLENGYRGVAIPEPYLKYRVRGDSMFHSTTQSFKIWTYQLLAQKHAAIYSAYADEMLGITTCNGPGYLFDNPTLWYPALEYASNTPSNSIDLAQTSSRRLFYLYLRSLLIKPYDRLVVIFPRLRNFTHKIKKILLKNE